MEEVSGEPQRDKPIMNDPKERKSSKVEKNSSNCEKVEVKTELHTELKQNDAKTNLIAIRLLFRGNRVGSFIGTKGSKIISIRNESGCEVKVKGNVHDYERIVYVNGEKTGVTLALLRIAEHIEADLNDQTIAKTSKIASPKKSPVTLYMIVSIAQCGSIIGKGGHRLRNVREKTGCQVKIPNEILPNSNEKVITFTGTPTMIHDCINSISLIISEESPNCKRKYMPYVPAIYPPSPVFGMEGFPRRLWRDSFVPPGFFHNHHSNNNIHHFQPGPGLPWNGQFTRPLVPPCGLYHQDPRFHGIPADTISDHFDIKLPQTFNHDGSVEVKVDKDKMGLIIGRGGSTIREIRMRSTPDIKIKDAEENSTFRKITIGGNRESIDRAIFCLHECVNGLMNFTLPYLNCNNNYIHRIPIHAARYKKD